MRSYEEGSERNTLYSNAPKFSSFSIIQIFALLLAKDKNLDALFSILVSAATLGFTSAMTNYDWDTSPTNRLSCPMFYGYVPDKSLPRVMCFLSMMSLSFAHVLLLTFSCALLAAMNVNWLFYYLAADMAFFFLYKMMRGDFYYFLNLNGGVRLFGAFLERFAIKVIVSFTLMIQLRHPNEGEKWVWRAKRAVLEVEIAKTSRICPPAQLGASLLVAW